MQVSSCCKEPYREFVYRIAPSFEKGRKKLMEEVISMTFERKETKRGVDYRKSLIKLTTALNGKVNNNVYQILLSLCEIQHILY